MDTTAAPQESIWSRLAAGKLPTLDVNTEVGMTNASLLNLGGVIFLAGFLIVLTWFVLKNQK
jgi:hypothetical protein